MARTLRGAGLDLGNATAETLRLLVRYPHLLTPQGSAQLRAKLQLFASWRLALPLCPLLLARCPSLLKEPDAQLQVGGRWLLSGA